jgi:transposase
MADSIRVPLNLPELQVLQQSLQPQQNRLTVWVQSRRAWCRCPSCGYASHHDVQDDRWRTVQDLDALGYHVFLRLRQRRFYCRRCRRRFMEGFESVDVQQRQTGRLQAWLVTQSRSCPLLQAARSSPVSYRVLRYLCFKVGQQRAQVWRRRALPKRIGVDEFATRKGHSYATVVVALTRHAVCGVTRDRTQAALERLLRAPGARPRQVREAVEAVIDMWEPFYQALRTCCPQARIVIDRFHVERHLWQAVDACRRRLSKNRKNRKNRKSGSRRPGPQTPCPLKAARALFLVPARQLSPQQRAEREMLLAQYPELRRCVQLAECLHRWYSTVKDRQHADWQLGYWLRQLRQSGIPELVSLAEMLRRWRREIVNYFCAYATNGITEGFNTKIKLLKRTGYGRLTFEHLTARIFLECGRSP